ncbi:MULTISPECIES: hypothetical protein [Paraburkholderia]|uniref:hypothetical protein n=1 Tax=Paraburkholderia TaxID=1822464 RepID=UPI00225AC7FC|nr:MULTISPECIES: hypothetical protein [Paraburkholderia]MCX4163924.1 hypothetical protein [Paraburkholderia megapolitana]MDN7159419.1 hypothetical protein [Paraburkholderia sp. CHISQ3]MDQ6496466.1 hypothetical protein [Paraburkholderia megapolitana]
MDDITYTKGIYTATATVRPLDDGKYHGIVSLARDAGDGPENTVYEVEASSPSPEEAFEEAKALAHRILGEIDL